VKRVSDHKLHKSKKKCNPLCIHTHIEDEGCSKREFTMIVMYTITGNNCAIEEDDVRYTQDLTSTMTEEKWFNQWLDEKIKIVRV
jgi:hypothetical protein